MPPFVHPHQEIINGLMHVVGYLTDNPGLPAPSDVTVNWLMGGNDSDRVAKVREVARFLNIEPAWDESAREVWAYWRFPGGVTFAAIAQLQETAAAAPTQELPAVDVDQPWPEIKCQTCGGTGLEPVGDYYESCTACLGKGMIAVWVSAPEVAR